MTPTDKPLVWLEGKIKSPPFSKEARLEAGYLLRLLQKGQKLTMPHARAMPSIGKRCYELRIRDREHSWRIIYRLDEDAVVLAEVFSKKSNKTPKTVIEYSKRRLRHYDEIVG